MGFVTEEKIIGARCDACQKPIVGEVIRATSDDPFVRTFCCWRCAAQGLAEMLDVKTDDPVLLSLYTKDKK